jgi:hypothetical protein
MKLRGSFAEFFSQDQELALLFLSDGISLLSFFEPFSEVLPSIFSIPDQSL